MMVEWLVCAALVLLAGVLFLQVLVLRRKVSLDLSPVGVMFGSVEKSCQRTEGAVREEISRNRDESLRAARDDRAETDKTLRALGESLGKHLQSLMMSNGQALEKMRDTIEQRLTLMQQDIGARADTARTESAAGVQKVRDEVARDLKSFGDTLGQLMQALGSAQRTGLGNVTDQLGRLTEGNLKKLDEMKLQASDAARQTREDTALALKSFGEQFEQRITSLTESSERRLETLRQGVEEKLKTLQEDNSKSLEQMRQTVDEKLQGTLEKRLGESFKLVSDRLEQVHKGLGEMQTLATGVGDLKRVLTNVKSRGTWGEVQLGALLEQVLTSDQYECNFVAREGGGPVEFAIKLPNRGDEEGKPLYVPIDAKFPVEDYQRLIEAQERGDQEGSEEAAKQLENRIRSCAKDICDKYINPPVTTDFAILFLPTEGLFAEVLRRTGLPEILQRNCRVMLAGPTTLWSLLSSLQMGFRTLAIQKRSSEVWKVLGAVKAEFATYSKVMEKVKKKLDEASSTIETDVARRTRVIQSKLKNVEALPQADSSAILLLSGDIEPEAETAEG